MYPPGQFAAWNRRQAGRPGEPAPATAGPPMPGLAPPSVAAGQAYVAERHGSGYFGQEGDTDPGYSSLAVSDPAADVTSTQTWRAVADGRATGTWTAPPRPDIAVPDTPRPDSPRPDVGRPGIGRPETSRPDADQPLRDQVVPPTGRSRSGTHAMPARSAPSPSRSDSSGSRPVPSAPAARANTIRRVQKARGEHPAAVVAAAAGAVVLILGAAAALYFGAKIFAPASHAAAKPPATPAATVTPSPSASLGPYGHIASRAADPVPLTIAQLYPAKFAAEGGIFVLMASRISGDCTDAVTGSNMQSAVSAAGCSQVARATYVDVKAGMMGTIGVLNLKTAGAATRAARAAGSTGFITQLPGRSGPAHKIGQGTGLEEAAAKGHYLILIWAELTDLAKPKNSTQNYLIGRFMTALLEDTANVSLSNRMLTGTPR
jgi:hypothetical protein